MLNPSMCGGTQPKASFCGGGKTNIAPCGGGGQPKASLSGQGGKKIARCGGKCATITTKPLIPEFHTTNNSGMRVNDILNPSQENINWKKIQSIDLLNIRNLLCSKEEGLGWSDEFASNIETQYKQFLWLCVSHPDQTIVPDLDVDAIWHKHILDTRKYAQDCENNLGFFLHHNQGYGSQEHEKGEWKKDFETTQQLLQKYFPTNLIVANDEKFQIEA